MKYWPHQRSWNSGVLIKLYPVAGDKFLRILNISIVKKWKFINSIRDKSCLFLVVLISRDCFYLQMMRKSLPWNRFILVFYLVSDHPFSTLPKIFLKQHLVNPPFKRVNTSNLMMFECCFLIPWHHENCNAMSSFTVLRHVPWNTFICSAVQCFH